MVEVVKDESLEGKERIRVGVKIIKQLSTTFYGKSRMIFDELVTNARDAMASEVSIDISPDMIIVTDNGEGMSREELTRFFYISHTERVEGQIRNLRGIKRKVIGKFGIGKLSMYQICRTFDITTWKDGVESHATFNFEELEKKKFIDEVELSVQSKKTDKRGSGTVIVLTGLKKAINPEQLRKELSFSMPLSPDFKILVNGYECQKMRLGGTSYKIDKDVPGVGQVRGEIIFTDDNLPSHEAGIYIRVFGRVVNDDPRILDLSSLRSALVFSRRTWGDLNVDSLNDAIQSNRNSFIKDDPRYQAFIKWLVTKLNQLNFVQYKSYSLARAEEENKIISREVVPVLRNIIKYLEPKKGRKTPVIESAEEMEKFNLHGDPYTMKVEPAGARMPESIIDKERQILVINSDHPQYKLAQEFKCQDFLAMKAAIIVVALEYSRSINQFRRVYNRASSMNTTK